ncbi:helix-turn-helix domain-containing protein [Listeria seeligeri]|uniref:helix-turn-helix domain-containing protein n=1 Tax=Listeria seeligeri TaxID=1640 RepID=UPI001626ED5E|nr:helix-turn-helix transcriptional regulator [Listeria seeligeri]EFS0529378.1 helix-turn-helix transcriptional regulator [Listeria monocytogenes]EFU8668358.1 helix-turn-helix transcriptional regulator [Listeria monocytogenes]MBC1832311.1 helix-turn-helix transcriptional regulator [Listeria seeligeri]MBC1934616.1 helix-turn-helix transcriptional regulator [Listeria seeligeri]MBF2551645.1 helix-turn-helix transcriptional regulator [Listeria seeligeri]
MIHNNLSVLLAERNIKITRVAKDTGISRSTITAIAQNDSKMIQMETIDTLCRYLNISPQDFFEFVPINIEINVFPKENNFILTYNYGDPILNYYAFDLYIDVQVENTKETFSLSGERDTDFKLNNLYDGSRFEVCLKFDNDSDKQKYFTYILPRLNYTFQSELTKKINAAIESDFKLQLKEYFRGMEDFNVLNAIDYLLENSDFILHKFID